MDARLLATWWNLIYVIPFGLALVYLGVYAVSGLTFGEDLEIDHDVDHDVDIDVDADADADADGDAEVGGGGSHALMAALGWLGVGRIPLSLVLMVLLLTWGGIGFAVNQLARPFAHPPALAALASIPAAFFGAMLCTRGVSRFVGAYLPTNETYAKKRAELLGSFGSAVFDISQTFGVASVRDDRGNRHQVNCRVAPGRPALPKGSRLILVGYDPQTQFYQVVPDDLGHPADALSGKE